MSVGIAAAISGSGMAYADDTASSTGPASSASAESESSPSAEASDDTGDDGDAAEADSDAGDESPDVDSDPDAVEDEVAEEVSDEVPSEEEGDDAVPEEAADRDTDGAGAEASEDTAPVGPEEPGVKNRGATRSETATAIDQLPAEESVSTEETDFGPADVAVKVSEPASDPLDTSPPASAPALAISSSAAVEPDSVTVAEASRTVAPMQTATVSAAESPAAPTTLAELLRALFLNFQRTYFNKMPTAKPVQKPGQSSQGVVTGTVGASDPDGDPLEVELSAGPKRGSVQVGIDGNYTYTPSAELAAGGGTDTFTVVVRETNADEHTHGFQGMWDKIFGGTGTASGTIVKTVTVTIAKVAADDPAGGTGDAGSGSQDQPAQSPGGYDAGLKDPFQHADQATGKTLNVRDYGATSSKSSDNDATAIQKAINAAQAGDVVYIPDGTYHVKSTITLKTGVSLIGQSRESTVLTSAFSTWSYLFSNPHAVIYAAPGVNNLTVSSFTITQASGKIYDAGVRLGSESGQVSRIAVKDLFVERHRRFGIFLQNANNILVDGNIIKNASALDGGGSGYGVNIDGSGSHNNWIRHNTIGPVIRHGILIQESAHHNLVEHNTITGAVSGAIDLHGEDEYSNEIRYNTVADCVRDGTSISANGAGIEIGEYSGVIGTDKMHDNSGPNNWIHHNVVYNCTCGLRIVNNSNNTWIEDNLFYDNLEAGIKADLAPLEDLYIRRNTIYGNGSGIVLHDVVRAVLEDNTVTDNDKYGLWTNGGVTDYLIAGNIVTGNGTDIVLGSQNGTVV
ncbi:right-handed parallel beta-helix repeat-containing protein [Mycobacterium sp. NAZ190054]|uniref:right-handed parallel beta-helix repeat-containing protein n=1 Tax=Mycobacterium sp. NAZ190054 TaxID=1747766 RepID=UPI0012E383B6|nr:right-handed parallel beta-helix repeat-containing protein [Mycobacterium sp. NAZ190054]